jgi:hypothetical protein
LWHEPELNSALSALFVEIRAVIGHPIPDA